jgi:hypothetical protein
MPGQQKMQTGKNNPNQQAAIQQQQQQQQQQEETQSESAIDFDSLSAAEYENVCRLATANRSKVSQNDMNKILLNLQRIGPRQKDYIHKKGMDPVTYFFRYQALKQLQRRSRQAPSDTHSSGEVTPRDTDKQNGDLSGLTHPQLFIRPSSSKPDEKSPHDDSMSISTPGMEVGDTDAHNVSKVAEDSETHRRQAHVPRSENMQYVLADVARSLQKQGPFIGWRAKVTARDWTYEVHQLYV